MYLNKKNYSLSLLSLVVICLFALVFTFFFIHWGNARHPFVNDINQYYSYLNALFIDHDLTFTNNTNSYWLIETPIHRFVPKVTYGMAFFYAPFYLLAKIFAGAGSTGYEPVYAWFIHFGCILYVLMGLWFSRKVLLFWFNDLVASITLLLLFFGTNLFYYTLSESESVHGILFFLISFFLYHVFKWDQTGLKKHFILFCAGAGFVCLIRPTEFLVLLFPLLLGIALPGGIKLIYQKIVSLKWALLLAVLLFVAPLLPQLFYWKMQSGNYFFFSYGSSEGFFWADPQIINVFFSFRKGFFIYTPIMLFSVVGFILLYKKNRAVFYPALLYFIVNTYFICCWWDWSYGGSFGMRAFIHCFAVLVIPFACFIEWAISLYNSTGIKKAAAFILLGTAVFFCVLNLLQSNLYKHQIIHYDGMNKKAYWFTFLKKRYTRQELDYLTTLFKSPDYEARRKGMRDE
jgi:hypothetical protein